MPAEWARLRQLRLTFRIPGVYSLVVAASSDHGSTHLAQLSYMTMEAL